MGAVASTAGEVDVRVLGPLQLVGANGPVEVRQGLPRILLAALVVRAGETVATDVLIDQLWGDRPPANPGNALQVQVSYLRRQLREAGDGVTIEREGAGYRLAMPAGDVDARRFERAVHDAASLPGTLASAPDAERMLERIDAALALWRGAPYADAMYLPFVDADVARLEELRLVALEQRAELLDALGRHGEAVAWLQPLVADHPLRERLWVLLATALYRSGRQADALRAIASAREHLVEELGIDPGPELKALEQRILDHDPGLSWSPLPRATDGEAAPATTAPEAPVRRRRAIPASISPLIGRRWEVDAVGELLTDDRLVTLVGPGGVGKTRIAFEAAARSSTETVVIELGAVREPGELPSLVAAAVGVPTLPGRDPLDVVADRIGHDPWLLVLDTCEHLVDAVADAATALLRACDQLRVLATSRQPLGVSGERAWPVPVLELPDPAGTRAGDVLAAASVRLFVERARATNPRFELDDGNAATVAAICRALDGLPLAIELAAARTSVLSPQAVLERLEDRFGLLTGAGRHADSRQRSLRATLEWSVDLLDDHDRRFLAALGVFAGSFDLPAVEAVTARSGDALDAVAALVDRSLVVAGGDDRYLLLDTVRAYALELLDGLGPPIAAQHRRRHAVWYAGVAEACDPYGHGPLPQGWPRLRADAANLRAALRWAFGPDGDAAVGGRLVGSLAGSLVLDGAFTEVDHWLGQALRAELDDVAAAKVLRGVAVVALYQGRFQDSLAAARASLARSEASGESLLVASSSLTVGSALWGVGDLRRSADTLRDAAARFDAAGDVRGRGFALARLARTLTAAGDAVAAVEVATAAVDDLEASSDDWMRVPALEHLAAALWRAGDLDAAAARAAEAVAAAEQVRSYSGGVAALDLLGRVRLAAGDVDGAEQAHLDAVERATRVANTGAVADALEGIAEARSAAGDPTTAAWVLGAATAVRERAGVPVPPARRAALDDLVAAIRRALGDEAYARAADDGRRSAPPAVVARLRAG